MKTQSTIKTASALFSASLLLSLSGHAAQNFNVSQTFSTQNYSSSSYGARSTLSSSDNYTLPQGTTPYTYAVTAAGVVTGKIPGRTFTAADGSVTAKLTAPNTASLNATLKMGGVTVMGYVNESIPEYESPHFIKEVGVGAAAPFTIPVGPAQIPFVVDVGMKASADACLRATATFSPGLMGLPKVTLSAGPEVDIAASAEASLSVGVPGFSAGPGVVGTVKIGTTALKANVDLVSTMRFVRNGQFFVMKPGVRADAKIIAQLPGIRGSIGVFLRAEGFGQVLRSDTLNIASFSIPAPAPVTLLGPVSYQLF